MLYGEKKAQIYSSSAKLPNAPILLIMMIK